MPRVNEDVIVANLARLGSIARAMPPAWDGAKITSLAAGPQGQYFGKMLPGRGLYLAHDLKALGIKKPIPHVYERSPLMRAVEAADRFGTMRGRVFDAERFAVRLIDALAVMSGRLVPACAITSYDGIITARAGGKGEDINIVQNSFTTVALAWASLYRAGGLPQAGTYTNIPGGGAKDRSDVGAFSLGLTNPTNPDKKYLLTLGFGSSQQINVLLLLDLLVAAGNILSTSAAAQTVNTTALTRYTTGAGVLATLEVTTAQGATAQNFTLSSYTNQAGTAARANTAEAMVASAIVRRLQPALSGPFVNLQAGDYGVRSVETATFSAANAAGVVALNLFYPLCWTPGVAAGGYVERDSTAQIDGLTELVQTAGNVLGCLTGYILPNAVTSGGIYGFLRTCAG